VIEFDKHVWFSGVHVSLSNAMLLLAIWQLIKIICCLLKKKNWIQLF